jgi:NADH-quinone oxidoreductase subunit J
VLDAYSLMMYYVPIGAFLGLLFFFEWMYLVYKDKWILDFYIDLEALAFNKAIFFNNTNLIGQLLFNNYYHLFIIISFILLVSMIGAINLTSEFRLHIKRSKINVLNLEKKVIFWKT